jgi:flagella basal body P-ring formation protein FlgA
MMNNIKIFLIFFLFLALSPAYAQKNQFSHQEIEQFVYNFLKTQLSKTDNSRVEINVSRLDPRINIQPCANSLQAKMPERHNNRHLTIKVFCDQQNSWHFYLNARVSVKQPVVIVSQNLAKGSVLTKDNLAIDYIDTFNIRGEVYTDIKTFIGAKSRRRLASGQPLTKKAICVVCKGDTVTLIAQSSDFTLKTLGVAMENGFAGEQISVKNKKSGKMVQASVKSVNKVIINL